MFFWRLFSEAVAKSISGAVGLQGAGGSGALDGGGDPFGIPGEGCRGRSNTPSGQSGTGTADLKASPLPPAFCQQATADWLTAELGQFLYEKLLICRP